MVCFPLGGADEAQELELRHSPVEACVQAGINRGPVLFPTFNDRQPALEPVDEIYVSATLEMKFVCDANVW